MDGLRDELKRIAKDLEQIEDTRVRLKITGESDLQTFSEAMLVLGQTWKCTRDDAARIKVWLEQGKDVADLPKYLATALGHSIGICEYASALCYRIMY